MPLPSVQAVPSNRAVPAATVATAAPTYKSSSATKSIDDASYSGPWPDNWDVTVQVCAARSGSTVYAYADVRWRGPTFYGTASTIFDGAKVRVQIMQSREGTDPVVAEQDFQLKDQMETPTSSGDHTGHYRTGTIRHSAGSGAYGNATLYLDWHKDGHGYRGYDYTGSPTV
ncbi:hypothetical protein ACFCV9_10780 [Streptomyces sp. NPDC056367]|uniref:hypothetical protein n=1 Tax=Streptomyces sp. NPDC056367 TaxID=3345797 RepID=UPI0035DBBC88